MKQVENGELPLFSLAKALAHYPQVAYEPLSDIIQGKKIKLACEADEIAVCDKDEVMAIYRRSEDDVFSCVRGLW